jgi:hypothetical protein
MQDNAQLNNVPSVEVELNDTKQQLQVLREKYNKLRNQEFAVIGDTTALIKRTENGAIKAVRANVKLFQNKGQLAEIEGKVMITAAGYEEMNRVAGVSVLTPDTLRLPDKDHPVVNPYPIVDPQSGSISKVWVKKMAVGYSPTGNLVITSSTLLYDIQMYFIQDIYKTVRYNKEAGRICMEQTLSDEEKQKGAFFKINEFMGVWIDLSHKDILKNVNTFIQNKLFAERKAQTICERNVLKKHPSLAVKYVDPVGEKGNLASQITVTGFTTDLTREELMTIAHQANKGEEINLNGKQVEYIEVEGEITEEDVIASRDEEEAQPENQFEQEGVQF